MSITGYFKGGRRHAHFTATEHQRFIEVRDDDVPGQLSVTNDAEEVVAKLAKASYDLRKPIVYRDTEGRWDRLLVSRGQFAGFGLLDAPDLEPALHALGITTK